MTSALNGLGEIVSWTSPRSVTIDELRKAMVDANIDESLARDMRPSNAFRRAIKDMEEHRVIRQTLNDNEYLHFQFTSEYLRGGEFHYSKEAELMLHKSTGVVSCSNNELREMAQRMVTNRPTSGQPVTSLASSRSCLRTMVICSLSGMLVAFTLFLRST